jgi:hypothetical protein
MNKISINIPSDSGSIGEYSIEKEEVCVSLAEEINEIVSQWFYFQVIGAGSIGSISFRIENANKSFYPRGWDDYKPVYSANGQEWHRFTHSLYSNGQLRFILNRPPNSFYVAWYQPYTLTRLTTWIERLRNIQGIQLDSPFEHFFLLSLGQPRNGSVVVIARQHPGETMASFFAEGLVNYLISSDLEVKRLLEYFQILVVPVMNPWGVVRGRHRYGENKINFNRSWDIDTIPKEIQYVRSLLTRLEKLLFFFDIHGDEVTKKGPNYIESESANKLDKTLRIAQTQMLQLITECTLDFEVLGTTGVWWNRLKKLIHPTRYPVDRLDGGSTAVQHVKGKYNVPAFTYEIKAHGTTSKDCSIMGKALGQALIKYSMI